MPEAITAIDSHAHVFERGLRLATVRRHAPEFDATLAEYLGLLDAHGVSHAVLVQPSFLGTDNSYFLDALRAWPQRLRGVAMLEPETSEAELRELHALGVRGMRLNLVGLPEPDLAGPEWQTLFARLRRLDWHVELHSDSAQLARRLERLLATGCRVVVDHFGRPATHDASADEGFNALLRQAESGRVWVKLSAAYRSWSAQDGEGPIEAARKLLAHFGAQRLVWGSDWPHTQHQSRADFASTQAALARWVPDAAARRQVLVETPAQLFDFD
jgi:predicted TIM-barrel fold metal-dependent hydrolase